VISRTDLAELTTADIETGAITCALLPVGALEGHGPHLPYGTDTFIAHELARRVARRVRGAVVLPPLAYGMSWAYRAFPLTLSLSTETLTCVLVDVLTSVIENDVRRIVVINGHDGNVAAIEAAGRRIEKEHGVAVATLDEWWSILPSLDVSSEFAAANRGHAGEPETALMLATDARLVRLDLARAHEGEPDLRWYGTRSDVRVIGAIGRHYPEGHFADPTEASARKGELLADAVVERVVAFLEAEGKAEA
jgi:creatinine amidohydrolase